MAPSAASASRRKRPGRPNPTGRYTPPIPKSQKVSPRWMGPLILSMFVLGVLVIILDYMDLLPGGVSDWYLVVGLVVILAGFVMATQYR